MKQISLDNGHSFMTAAEAAAEIEDPESVITWEAVWNMMDPGTREQVEVIYSPETEEEFLQHYLELALDDLIIG